MFRHRGRRRSVVARVDGSDRGALRSNHELILTVHEAIAKALGEGLPSAMGALINDRLDHATLRFNGLATVPAIHEGLQSEVRGVHFLLQLDAGVASRRN